MIFAAIRCVPRCAAIVSLSLALQSCVSSGSEQEEPDMSSSSDPPPSGPVREGFEDTELGSLPRFWTPRGFGQRTLGVTDVQAARGGRSLQIEVPASESPAGALLAHGNLGDLAGAHFGRVFLRIQGPGVSQFVHFDAFEGTGPWENRTNAVRWASTGTGVGTDRNNWSWIYNVQRSQGGEFGTEGERSAHPRVDEWMCLEWRLDGNLQESQFWLDGAEVQYLAQAASDEPEIPVFVALAVGFQKFQPTDAFLVWVDEVAFDLERIGCDG
jgi:hypothetical protein